MDVVASQDLKGGGEHPPQKRNLKFLIEGLPVSGDCTEESLQVELLRSLVILLVHLLGGVKRTRGVNFGDPAVDDQKGDVSGVGGHVLG